MSVSMASYKNECSQEEMYERWSELIGFFRLYPDIFLEWITPTEIDEETGEVRRVGITLGRWRPEDIPSCYGSLR